jgi:hypothetical protein
MYGMAEVQIYVHSESTETKGTEVKIKCVGKTEIQTKARNEKILRSFLGLQ